MKVIALAGSGRTGSTLLSVLLSQQRDSFNLGQLRDFPSAFLRDELCTCGARLRSCPVWYKVVNMAFGDGHAMELQRLHSGMAAFSSAAKRMPDWRGDPIDRLRLLHREDLSRLAALVDAAAAVTNARVLIDSSKSPEIALALSLTDITDVRVLNLVRDPRAVAVSWSKKVGFEKALHRSRDWLYRQAILARWSKEMGNRFALLRYEDFSARPKATLQQLLAWVGEKPDDEVFTSDSSARLTWTMQHLYPPANESFIAEKSESVEIREAIAWRDPQNADLFQAVNKIVRPGLSRYGYANAPLLASGRETVPDSPPTGQASPSTEPSQGGGDNPTLPGRPRATQYIFLICSERSGSNLIASMLNAHPEIGSVPPYHLCRDLGLNWHALIDDVSGQCQVGKVAGWVGSRLAKLQSAEAAAQCKDWLTSGWDGSFGDLARQIFGKFSGLEGKASIFIKENNIHRMLFFILKNFPGAKFVFQVRDPRDYLLSAYNRKEGALGNKFGSSLRALEIWREDQLGGLSAMAHLGRDRVFFQRYEDLVGRPETVLPCLCDFLGVSFDESMLEFHETEYSQALAVPGGPRENLSKRLMKDNFGKYRQGLTAEQIRMVEIYLGDLMERFGYERDFKDTAQASVHELFWPQFLEPVERFLNGEVGTVYKDLDVGGLGRQAPPIRPVYGRC